MEETANIDPETDSAPNPICAGCQTEFTDGVLPEKCFNCGLEFKITPGEMPEPEKTPEEIEEENKSDDEGMQ
jgi:hypothetical protein